MNDIKQEILDIVSQVDYDDAYWITDMARIREILETHTLEPIGDGTPLAQECADLIEEADRRAKENGRGDVAYRNAIHRLKLFLKDRKTSFFAGKEPIDDRPFDPTLCGFKATSDEEEWQTEDLRMRRHTKSHNLFLTEKTEPYNSYCSYIPWPATQSDGEKLLKLLGVLK